MDSQASRSAPAAAPEATAPEATSADAAIAEPSASAALEPAEPEPTVELAAAEAQDSDDDTSSESGWGPLHPLPRGLVELYGLLAVLFVLVPEWMAGSALFGFRETRDGSLLPPPSGAWKRLPELRLASLSLSEMRLLARQLGLRGYGRDSRERLTARLLKRLRDQR